MKMRANVVRLFWALALASLLAGARVADAAATAQDEFSAALRSRPNYEHGEAIFRTCSVCHGLQGQGVPDGNVPRISGQHASVLMKQLVDYRFDRRWDPRMQHFADSHHLPDAQSVADIATYVQALAYAGAVGQGAGSSVERGKRIYAVQCNRCHGESGQGAAKSATPALAGQHYAYIERQIYDAVDGRRPNFSAAHIRLLKPLERDDIDALADYLSRLARGTFADPPQGSPSHTAPGAARDSVGE